MAGPNTQAQIQASEQLMNALAAKRPDLYAKMKGTATGVLLSNALSTTFSIASSAARAGLKSTASFPTEQAAIAARNEPKIERPEQNRTNIPLLKG